MSRASVSDRGAALARTVRPFDAVVSPYHLTTREPAALVTLQLAERAVTLLLAPVSRETGTVEEMAGAMAEARRSAVYRRYMSSWEWAEVLFREGVLSSVSGGDDPVDDVRRVCARLATDDGLGGLARYARPELFADDRVFLQAASADVLKAGPDPGVSVPIAAGLDSFAAGRGLVVARSSAISVAQKAESRLGRVVFRVAVPALLQASAERVMLVRALLDRPREELALAVSRAFEGEDPAGVRAAADAYARAFETERADICSPPGRDEMDEVRLIVGETALVGMELPADAVLRSSMMALGPAGAGATGGAPAETGERVRALVVRPLGRP